MKRLLLIVLNTLLTILFVFAPPALASPSAIRVQVPVDPTTHHTVEQRNVSDRVTDYKPGTVKYLSIASATTGKTILFSSVDGKVTSSGKRLTPIRTIKSYPCGKDNKENCPEGQLVSIGGVEYLTQEIVQDDGTFGDSTPYIFWKDLNGVRHQQFVSEDLLLEISDQPVRAREVTLNLDKETILQTNK